MFESGLHHNAPSTAAEALRHAIARHLRQRIYSSELTQLLGSADPAIIELRMRAELAADQVGGQVVAALCSNLGVLGVEGGADGPSSDSEQEVLGVLALALAPNVGFEHMPLFRSAEAIDRTARQFETELQRSAVGRRLPAYLRRRLRFAVSRILMIVAAHCPVAELSDPARSIVMIEDFAQLLPARLRGENAFVEATAAAGGWPVMNLKWVDLLTIALAAAIGIAWIFVVLQQVEVSFVPHAQRLKQ